MKKIISVLTVFTILFALAGCSDKNEDFLNYTFRDDLGRQVTVTDSSRVAALLGSYADMWLLAGGTLCAAADDAWEDFELELPQDVVNLGSTHRLNKEAVLSARPQLVFASSKLTGHIDMMEALEGAGITVAYFDVSDFDSYLKVLGLMTGLTGKQENYEKYGLNQKEEIDAVIARHTDEKPVNVLVMRASAASIRVKNSNGTMLGGMLRDLGCTNIADSNDSLLENMNIESIIASNPDKIFFVQTGDDLGEIKAAVEKMFSENPLWQELDAVKNGEVYYMDKRLYNLKPNALFAKAYQNLEKLLYEE